MVMIVVSVMVVSNESGRHASFVCKETLQCVVAS